MSVAACAVPAAAAAEYSQHTYDRAPSYCMWLQQHDASVAVSCVSNFACESAECGFDLTTSMTITICNSWLNLVSVDGCARDFCMSSSLVNLEENQSSTSINHNAWRSLSVQGPTGVPCLPGSYSADSGASGGKACWLSQALPLAWQS